MFSSWQFQDLPLDPVIVGESRLRKQQESTGTQWSPFGLGDGLPWHPLAQWDEVARREEKQNPGGGCDPALATELAEGRHQCRAFVADRDAQAAKLTEGVTDLLVFDCHGSARGLAEGF